MTIKNLAIAAGGATAAVFLTIGLTSAAQAQRGATPPRAPAPAVSSAYNGPRTPDRKPDLNGIWQVLGTAHWNLEAHSAMEGVPAGLSVVEGGTIPYQPAALARRNENFQNRLVADPLRKCYMPGVPRATYLPFPFEITQTPKHMLIAYEFAHATRTVFLDGTPHMDDLDFWMGDARGKWEGDTLVIDTTNFSPNTSFRGASTNLHLIEKFRRVSEDSLEYYVTIEDPTVWMKPWTLMVPLKKTGEEMFEYACHEGNYGLPAILRGARAQEAAAR